MLDLHHYSIEYSRLVDVFRRVGKLGGKASLTASTEDGLWRASLEIQTHPVSVAQPGPARHPTAQPAAPHQEDAAGRRRSRRRRGPASALRSRARARAHQATLAARRQGTCQTPATRVQAAPPPHNGRKSLILAPQEIPDISGYQWGFGCQFVKAYITENPVTNQKIL